MAGIDKKNELINQILRASTFSPDSLLYKKRKAELEKMTLEQLNAELTKSLTGSYTAPWDRGWTVEKQNSVVTQPQKPAEQPEKQLSPREELQAQIKKDLLDCGIFVSKYNTPTLELLTQIYQEAPKNGNREYKEFVQKFQDIIFEYKAKPVKNPDELRKKLLCELNLDFYPSYPADRKKVEQMRLQNFTAQMISNIYKNFANEYNGIINSHSFIFDLTQALHKNSSAKDDADDAQFLSEKFMQMMSPENMSETEFKKFFKTVFKKDYSEDAAKDLMLYCTENPQLDISKDKKFREKIENLYDKDIAELLPGLKKLKTVNEIGNIVVLSYIGFMLHGSAPVTNLKNTTQVFNSALGLGEKANKVATGIIVGAPTMGALNIGYGVADNLLRGTDVSASEYADVAENGIKSMPMGGIFGGLDAIAVAPVLQKMAPNGLKAVDALLADGREHSMKDLLKAFYGKTTTGELKKIASFFGQSTYSIGVYGAATTMMNVGVDLIENGTDNIPEGQFGQYLWQNAKANFKDQGLMTFASLMIAGRTGGNAANKKGFNATLDMPEFKVLENNKIQRVNVNGKNVYKINGQVVNIGSVEGAVGACYTVAGVCVQNSNLNVENLQNQKKQINSQAAETKPKTQQTQTKSQSAAPKPETAETKPKATEAKPKTKKPYEAPKIRQETDYRLEDDAMSSKGTDSGKKRGLFGVFRGIINKYTPTQPQTKTEPVKSKDIQTPTKKAVYDKPLPQDSPIYKDIHKLSQYLAQKFDAQAANISPAEIDTMVKTLSTKYNVPENVILSIMSKLTQFGSYKQLSVLGQKLKDMGIEWFYVNAYTAKNDGSTIGISSNATLNYLQASKGHFELASDTGKQALILDDASLKYLENLKQSGSPEFDAILQNINDGNLMLINLDGTGLQVDGNYFSYTALDGGVNLQSLTEAVLQQTGGKTKNIDNVLNGSYKTRIQNIFGPEIANKVENINIESTEITPQTIAQQIKQNTPTANDIEISINAIIDERLGTDCSPTDRVTAVQTLGKYYDYIAEIYSNEGMAELMQNRQAQVEQIVNQLGKSMDDVVYLAPYMGKSYGLIAQMYAKVNNIPLDKFIVYGNSSTYNYKVKYPDNGKIIVYIDDVIGSGASALSSHTTGYDNYVKTHPDSNIIFASLTIEAYGQSKISNQINSNNRDGKDFILFDDEHHFQVFDPRYNASDMAPDGQLTVNKSVLDDLKSRGQDIPEYLCLTDKDIQDINDGKIEKIVVTNGRIPSCFTEIKEINMFIKLIGDDWGWGCTGICTAYPHMVPDNVTDVAAPLFMHMYDYSPKLGPLSKGIGNSLKIIKNVDAQKNKQ